MTDKHISTACFALATVDAVALTEYTDHPIIQSILALLMVGTMMVGTAAFIAEHDNS